jgi:hypothetical protein
VDDILIFGISLKVVNSTKLFLTSNFDMKDIGGVKIILGVRVIRRGNDIILSQEHYLRNFLRCLIIMM